MKPRAIVVFVPKHPHFFVEYKILYNCWKNLKLYEDTDLIVFCAWKIKHKIDNDCIIIGHRENNKINYPYINSIEIFSKQKANFIRKYKEVLKTDLDVFLTPAFKKWHIKGKKFFTGGGGYNNDIKVKSNIKKISKELNLNHYDIYNIGSTWYGSGNDVVNVGSLTTKVLYHILKNYFKNGNGEWPSWYRPVSSMYASEIAINHLMKNKVKMVPDKLDFFSTSKNSIWKHPHIHSWHTSSNEEGFSKFKFASGDYNKVNLRKLNKKIISNYCIYNAVKASKL